MSKKNKMVKAIVNGVWDIFQKDQLQPGTAVFSFRSGLYETLRTKNYQPVFLDLHLDRLLRSAESIKLKPHFKREKIKQMVNQVIRDFDKPEQRIRILLVPEKVIVYARSLNLNHGIYKGISAITVPAIRKDPHIKTTNYHVCLNAYKKAIEKDCFDAILLDEAGQVFEGSRSNIFWAYNDKLYTRESGVLPGITRQIVLKKSPFKLSFSTLNSLDFCRLDELFLTNSGSGIIPVVKVNNSHIGKGMPGPITIQLMKLYESWMAH